MIDHDCLNTWLIIRLDAHHMPIHLSIHGEPECHDRPLQRDLRNPALLTCEKREREKKQIGFASRQNEWLELK